MKPTKKVKKEKKAAKPVENKVNLEEEVRDLQGIVIGMGKRLDELTSLYKRIKSRMGL